MRLRNLLVAGVAAFPLAGTPPEDRLLLFAVRIGTVQLMDPLPAYADGSGGFRFPLGGLSRALGLAIQVDGARARGHAPDARRFELDLETGKATVGGRSFRVDPAHAEGLDGDIYLDPCLLGAWLELAFRVDPGRAVLEVASRRELPVQARWALEHRISGMEGRKPAGVAADPLPRVATPYALWDPPFINQTFDATCGRGGGMDLRGSTYLAGDLLGMTSTFFFTSDRTGPLGNFRGTLARRDPAGGLLGPLGAKVVEVGDLYVPPLALVGGTLAGRGFHVGNGLDLWQGQGRRYTLRGDLLPGWTVELYQDGILAAFQRSRPDGLYEFRDLPLRFGVNRFRLVFYGPEGQHREEARRLDLRLPLTPEGEFLYNAAATRAPGGPLQYQGELAYGLGRQLDVNVGLAQVAPFGGLPQRFAVGSLQGYLPGLSAKGTVARDLAGGTAVSAALATGWGWSALSLQHTWLNGYSSPEFSRARGLVRSRTRAGLDLVPGPLQFNLQATRDVLDAGRRDRLAAQVAGQLNGYSLSNQIVWERSAGQEDRWGTFRAGTAFGGFFLRGEATCGLGGAGTRLRTVGLQADTTRFRPWTLQTTFQRHLDGLGHQAGLRLYRDQGGMGVSFSADHSRAGGLTVCLGLQVSLGWEPRTRRYLPSGSPLAYGGAVSAQSRLEGHGPSQPPVAGLALRIDGAGRPPLPAPEGVIFHPRLEWARETSVSLAHDSIEDPFLKPLVPGFRIVPRPGKTVLLDFPLTVSGAINGTASLLGDGDPRPLGGMALELVDAGGRVCRETSSAYDGFFEVTGLQPGTYVLRVAAREAGRLDASLPPARILELTTLEPCREGISMRAVRNTGTAPGVFPLIAGSASLLGDGDPRPLEGLALELVDGGGGVCREAARLDLTLPPSRILELTNLEPCRKDVTLRAVKNPGAVPMPVRAWVRRPATRKVEPAPQRPAPPRVEPAPRRAEAGRPQWRLLAAHALAVPYGFVALRWLRRQ